MSKDYISDEKQRVKRIEAVDKTPEKQRPTGPDTDTANSVLHLQQQVGNQAVQRLLAQRSGDGGFALDDDTTHRINQARGGGQALDGTIQKQMGSTMGHDFSGVQVHTSSESDSLNQQLNARAFTTGQDIFFKKGEYNPGSSSGQELIAHELTHVVQQSSGTVRGSGSGMTVNPANDAFEQEADSVAKQAVQASRVDQPQQHVGEVAQRIEDEEDQEEMAMTKRDETVQRIEDEEDQEEVAMAKRDETVQRIEDEEDQEEMAMTKRDETVQRAVQLDQGMEEEDV